jgi:hypothetical protein
MGKIKMEKEEIKEEKKKISLREKARINARKFNAEFKKEMNTAIMAAFGFLIALVWKDVITNLVNNISSKSPFHGALVSALAVTIISVLGIMFFSRILRPKEEVKNGKK